MNKLLLLTQYFPPETGAPQNRLFETAKSFVSQGWDVRVLTAMPNYPTGKVFVGYKGKWSKIEEVDGIKIYRAAIYPSNSKRAIPRIFSMVSFSLSLFTYYLRVRKWKPSLIMVESPPLLLGFFGWLFCRLIRSKFWFNVSDIWPLSAKELGVISDGFLYRRLEWLERFIYRKANFITGQSEEIVRHIVESGNKAELFRNGVDPERFSVFQHNKKNGNNPVKLVYAGLLGVAQGIYSIACHINFKEIGIEFHVYGAGAEQKELENYILAHSDRGIIFHGAVSRDQIPEILARFDGYLVPLTKNIYGAVPSKIYEAMAMGLPIIFFGSGEGEQIVKKFDLGWTCSPGDFQELERALEEFCGDQLKRKEMSRNGIQASKTIFNRNIILNELIQKVSKQV